MCWDQSASWHTTVWKNINIWSHSVVGTNAAWLRSGVMMIPFALCIVYINIIQRRCQRGMRDRVSCVDQWSAWFVSELYNGFTARAGGHHVIGILPATQRMALFWVGASQWHKVPPLLVHQPPWVLNIPQWIKACCASTKIPWFQDTHCCAQ